MNEAEAATKIFLKAEDAAVKLVDALKRLEEESLHYEHAAGKISDAGASVQALSSAVSETSKRAAEAIDAIRAVGSPAIIDGLTQLNDSIEKALSNLELVANDAHSIREVEEQQNKKLSQINDIADDRMGDITTQIKGVIEQADFVTSVCKELRRDVSGEFESLAASIVSLSDEVEKKFQNQADAIMELNESMNRNFEEKGKANIDAVNRLNESLSGQLRSVKIIAIVAVAVAAIAAIMPLISSALS